MTTYHAEAERGERYWLVYVPEIERWTQARNLNEVEPMARDMVALMLDIAADSFDVEVGIKLSADVNRHLSRAERLREQAKEAQSEAAAEVRAAARALHDDGLSVRELGRVLGVSYQRAHQLVQC